MLKHVYVFIVVSYRLVTDLNSTAKRHAALVTRVWSNADAEKKRTFVLFVCFFRLGTKRSSQIDESLVAKKRKTVLLTDA